MNKHAANYYGILNIAPDADFQTLKRAYYRRAKECHPDLFGGDPAKEVEFKNLVEAFDVLSDPVRRRKYDLESRERGTPPPPGWRPPKHEANAIMDCLADDILEEMIVGNQIPRQTTLKTLLLDLTNTEKFCHFREGKYAYFAGNIAHASCLFELSVCYSPNNILYRFYLARTLRKQGHFRQAEKHLRTALRLGAMRVPPLRLERFRRELSAVRRHRHPLIRYWRQLFMRPVERIQLPPDEEIKNETERAINTMYAKSRSRGRRLPDRQDRS